MVVFSSIVPESQQLCFYTGKKEQCCVFYIISSFVPYDPLALRKLVISQLTWHSRSIKFSGT